MSSSVPEGRAPRRWGVRRWLLVVLAVVLAGGFQWAVVVGSPPKIAPSGIDGLTIPMISVQPEEFVDEITNEWLPLRPGAEWVRVGEVDGQSVVETTTVLTERLEVSGISATQVRTETAVEGAAVSSESADTPVVRLYAQDRDGNVWLLGQVGEWTLDDEGAVAGLAMPAAPRRGDGWGREFRDGVVTQRVRVGERSEPVVTAAGTFDEVQRFVVSQSGAGNRPGATFADGDVEVACGVGEVVRTWGRDNRLTLTSYGP